MQKNLLAPLVFLAGLLIVGWIAIGYAGNHTLAFAVAALIAACYLAGAFELLRYGQATATLVRALPAIGQIDDAWFGRLHPGLRNSVRLRAEGERVGLPAPALTPYLVGLLVLLGMLGTLLGMMATLRGTGLALESATDLDAIRSSLAAPVKGLGFAFGTSIAGVATSAALGLISALLRRERTQAVQQLDAGIAAQPGHRSRAEQRRDTFRLLQEQNALMPALVDRLQTLADTLERQQHAADERLRADQQAFHQRSEAASMRLAASLQQALHDGIDRQASAVGAALQPVVDATMAGLAEQSARLHASIEHAMRQQLDGASVAMQGAVVAVRENWRAAVVEQQRGNTALAEDLRQALQQFAATFEQRSTTLIDGVAERLEDNTARVADAWNGALARQHEAHDALSRRTEQAWAAASAGFEQRSRALIDTLQQSHGDLQAAFATRSDAMIESLQRSHGDLQEALQARDAERLAQWHEAFAALTGEFGQRWERSSEQLAAHQQQVCATLEKTAQGMSEQTQAQARATLDEISRLVAAASEAPRAAAEVVAELRQKLSDSMVRDTAMLEERGRLLSTLETLLDAVNHASTEQRGAIDALVSISAELLERVGSRFTAQIENERGKLDEAAAHVTGSAVEVASLGEAFGTAVQSFGESTAALNARLQGIESALEKSLARSDEQLTYYVAQAREVIELSMLSQKQIIGELQQHAGAASA